MALTLDGTSGIVSSGAISSSSNITATGSITTQSSTGIIFSDSSNQGAAASPFGLKNRIINGDMVISQRNGTSSVTPANDTYTLDRWKNYQTTASKYSVQQNAGSVTPPAGFTNYLGITSLSAYSVSSSDYYTLQQVIEGFNCADLAWGTANARTVTVSFWVRSSLTGTFGGAIFNDAGNRSYPFTYTISSANTWEYKTITIPGDTTGTWLTNNGKGIQLAFGLGAGSTVSGPAGAWAGTFYASATGATSVVGTNGATWYVTGVQLERNTTATPFEWLPYSTELALCRRYYQKLNAGGVAYTSYGSGYTFSSTGMTISSTLNPVMRTTPTATASGSNRIVTHAGGYAVTSFGGITGGTDTFYMTFQSAGTFSAATPGFVGPNGDTTASINLDAEL